MITSFSTVRLARITSAMLEVCVIVVRRPVAFVSDCDGATPALSSTSPCESAGSMPRGRAPRSRRGPPPRHASASASAAKERTTTIPLMAGLPRDKPD
jgi:hypothetical protein